MSCRLHRLLVDGAGLVEPQVQELQLLRRHPARQGRTPGLGGPDHALDVQHLRAVRLARLLAVQEPVHPLLDGARLPTARPGCRTLPMYSSTKSTNRRASWSNTAMLPLVMYAMWTRCPCSTSRMMVPPIADHVVVRVRAERRGPTSSPSARPGTARCCPMPVVEHRLADLLGRPLLPQQLVQVVFAEVLVAELLEALVDGQRQVHHRPPDQLRGPVARPDLPRPLHRGQLGGGGPCRG